MVKIVQLPTLPGAIDGTEYFPVAHAGGTYKLTIGDLISKALQGVNRPPESTSKTAGMIDTDSQVTGNIFLGVTDPDGDPWFLQFLGYNGQAEDIEGGSFQTDLGIFFLNPTTGDYTFTLGQGGRALNEGDIGHEIFTYTIADGRGGIATSTLTISITGTNSVPVVNYYNGATPVNTPTSGNIIAHYAFDYETTPTILHFKVSGDATTYTAGSTATISGKATISIASNGDYTLTPVTDYTGPIPVITYTVTDGVNDVDAFLTLAVTPLAPGTAPLLLYTDKVAGAISGGENDNGCFLTLCGYRLGTTPGLGTTTKVYIGGVEVVKYFPIQDAAVANYRTGMQALTVQVGALGGATLGVPLPITVVVSGNTSNANNIFTPNPGRTFFASLTGSDTTGVPDDITHPFRLLQSIDRLSGIYAQLRAGDHVVVRVGNWTDIAYDTAWIRFRDPDQQGSNPTGEVGTGWISFEAYPGEDVHYSTPVGGNKGGFQGPGSAFSGTTGDWIVVSNFRMDVPGGSARDAAPVNMQYTTGHWRVVNNKLGPWVAGDSAVLNAACLTGQGNFVFLLGNYCHDVEGTSEQQNHGLYAGTGTYGWEVAFNVFENCIGGSAMQFNDSDGGTGNKDTLFGTWQGFTDCLIHHNFVVNTAKYGLLFADIGTNAGALSARVWNNVFIRTGIAPLRLNTTTLTTDLTYAYNTLYDCCTIASGTGNGYLRNEGNQASPGHVVRTYNNIMAFGPHTVAGCQWFVDFSGQGSGYTFSRNLYYAFGQTPTAPADVLAIFGDPLFNDATDLDLSLQNSSPAANAGTQALPTGFIVSDDFTAQASRAFGGAPEIGAYEIGQTTPFLTSAPATNSACQVGVASTCSSVGSWGNSPTSYARQAVVGGTLVGSPTTGTSGTASYTPVGADAHKVLQWQVSATNSDGTTVVTVTIGTIAVGVGAPVFTAPPAISGTNQATYTLTGTTGTVTGTVDSYTYQWLRVLSGVTSAISGATSSTYVLTGSDVGYQIGLEVRAQNSTTGYVAATASLTGTIAAAPADPTYVQNDKQLTPASSNATFTMPSSVAGGSVMVGAFQSWDQAPDNYTKSDTQGHASSDFAMGARVNYTAADNPHLQFSYVTSTATGSYAMTVNQNGGQAGSGLVMEISGVRTGSLFDIPQETSQGATAAVTLTSTTALTKPKDLILLVLGVRGTGHTVTPDTGDWDLIDSIDGAFSGCFVFKRKVSATETFDFAATIDSDTGWVIQSLVFASD